MPRESLTGLGPPQRPRICLAVNIESFASRTPAQQLDLMGRLLWVLTVTFESVGILAASADRRDSVNGQVLLMPAGIDARTVLPKFLVGLLAAVREVNKTPGPGGRLRLLVALGREESNNLDAVSRLLDSVELHAALAAEAGASTAIALSDDLFRSVAGPGRAGFPGISFRKIQVTGQATGFAAEAWIATPVSHPLGTGIPAYSAATTGIIDGTVVRSDERTSAAAPGARASASGPAGLRAASASAWAMLSRNKGTIAGAAAVIAGASLTADWSSHKTVDAVTTSTHSAAGTDLT